MKQFCKDGCIVFGCLLTAFFSLNGRADKPTYENPPERVVWMEGEDCKDTNWNPGVITNDWWFGSAHYTGTGMLFVARPADDKTKYHANFDFDLPNDGTYTVYWMGRIPGYLASPIHWQVNDGPETRQPTEGADYTQNLIDQVMNYKVGLVKLGNFSGKQGTNHLYITVNETTTDKLPYISQAIDKILISKSILKPAPGYTEVLEGVDESDVKTGHVFSKIHFSVDPGNPDYPGEGLASSTNDWSHGDKAKIRLKVTGSGPFFEGRLRCYTNQAGSFVDVIVHVVADSFGQAQDVDLDLSAIPAADREHIEGLRFYTFSKWYSEAADFDVEIISLKVLDDQADPNRTVEEIGPGAPPPANVRHDSAPSLSGFVWNFFHSAMTSKAAGPAGPTDDGNGGKEIKAGSLRVMASPQNGGLRDGWITQNGTETSLFHQLPKGLVAVGFLKSGLWSPQGTPFWSEKDNQETLTMEDDKVALEADYVPDEKNSEMRIKLKIRNKSDEPISEIQFMGLGGIALGESDANQSAAFGANKYTPQELPPSFSLVTPAGFTHDWVCFFNGKQSLGLRWEDASLMDTEVFSEKANHRRNVALSKFPKINPGATWTSPDLVVGADNTGSWKASADRFSQWWYSWAAKPVIPEWFQSTGGVAIIGGLDFYGNESSDKIKADLAHIRETTGLSWFHVNSWLPYDTEAWYPVNFRISDAQAKIVGQMTDQVRGLGGRTSFYSNPLLTSLEVDDFDQYAKDFIVTSADGTMELTEHTNRHHPFGLPFANAAWAEHYFEAIQKAVFVGKPDALYLDQLGAVPMQLDYAPEKHGHTNYGDWRGKQGEFAKVLLDKLHGPDPDLVTFIEGVNVAVQQYVTFSFLCSEQLDQEIFRYTFPSYYNSVGEYGEVDPPKLMRFGISALVTGQPLAIYGTGADKFTADERARFVGMVNLKRAIDPKLYKAVFRGLQQDAGITAGMFRTDKGWLIPFTNPAAQDTDFSLDAAALNLPTGGTATIFTLQTGAAQNAELTHDGDKVKIKLPPGAGLVEIVHS